MENDVTLKLKRGVKLPVIMAPMFLISNPKMVLDACKAGIIGTFPLLNARTAEVLDQWMLEIKTGMQKLKEERSNEELPMWGVNFVSHHSANKRYNEDLALIEKHQPDRKSTRLNSVTQ